MATTLLRGVAKDGFTGLISIPEAVLTKKYVDLPT